MKVEVQRYRKPDGYETRFWSVLVDGDLLAVTVYRKGAEAVARALNNLNPDPNVTNLKDPAKPVTTPHEPAAGVAPYRTR